MSNSLISTNPLDGQEIGRVEIASKRVVEDTVEKARKAQQAWRKYTAQQRASIIKDCPILITCSTRFNHYPSWFKPYINNSVTTIA